MIRTNELMIGDWVRNDLGEIQRIDEIRQDDVMLSYNDYYSYDEIDPVPLTPEILEKNGFKRVRDKLGRVFYSIADDYFDLTIDEITDSIWCIEYDDLEAHFPTCRNLVAHVHELQHCLKLVGIEKEITI